MKIKELKLNALITIIISLLFVNEMIAQTSKNITATYTFYNYDDNIKNQDVVLKIKKNEALSRFLPETKEALYSHKHEDIEVEDNGNFSVDLGDVVTIKDSIGQQFHLTDSLITFRDFLYDDGKIKTVIVKENMPKFNWVLDNETRKIGNFNCNKATLDFRGRSFEVWYTYEIPTNFGPWKFFGLPGLIVKALSLDKKVGFELNKIETKIDSNENFVINEEGQKIDFNQFLNLNIKNMDSFISKIKASLPRGAKVDVDTYMRGIEQKFEKETELKSGFKEN